MGKRYYQPSKHENKDSKRQPSLPRRRNPTPAIELAFKPVSLRIVFQICYVLGKEVHVRISLTHPAYAGHIPITTSDFFAGAVGRSWKHFVEKYGDLDKSF